MPHVPETVELEIKPIPPDTVASVKEELIPLVETTLREAGREDLLSDEQLQIEIEKTFPVDQAVIVGLAFLSGIALETYKALILPKLKKRFEVKEKPRGKKQKGSERE